MRMLNATFSAKWVRVSSAIITMLLSPAWANANNNYFLPGDAFFHAVLTEEWVKHALASDEMPLFDYSIQGGYSPAFGGYAGYGRATIENMDRAFLEHLAHAYRDVRTFNNRELRETITKDGDRVLEETNGVHVFFYRDDFDIQRFDIGLRYNEHWMAEAVKFGHPRNGVRLCCFVPEREAVIASWRDSDLVPALNVRLPQAQINKGKSVTEPIVIHGKVKAIVLPHWSLKGYFDREDTLPLYVVNSESVQEFTAESGKWIRLE